MIYSWYRIRQQKQKRQVKLSIFIQTISSMKNVPNNRLQGHIFVWMMMGLASETVDEKIKYKTFRHKDRSEPHFKAIIYYII